MKLFAEIDNQNRINFDFIKIFIIFVVTANFMVALEGQAEAINACSNPLLIAKSNIIAMKTEIWKDISGYDGKYRISNYGRVKSLKYRNDKLLSIGICNGYEIIGLWKNNKVKTIAVHRLVATAFIHKPITCKKLEINHKNGIKSDNYIDNLEWVTRSENIKHSYDVLGRVGSYVGKEGRGHPSNKPVIQYDLGLNYIAEFYSILNASHKTNTKYTSISCALHGGMRSAGGFIWRFK